VLWTIARRILERLLLILGVLILVFFLMRLSAGDPAKIKAGLWSSPDIIEKYQDDFGTNRTIWEQLGTYLLRLSRGDLGESFRYRKSTLSLIGQSLPYTLALSGISLIVVIVLALWLGVLTAIYPNSWIDHLGLTLSTLGQAIPVFWGGLLLVLIFSVQLGWLPSSGFVGAQSLILPVAIISLTELPWQLRIVRASMLESLSQEFIRTARAFGIAEWRIRFIYALRNAAIPYLTTLGVQAGYLLGGAVIAEIVFNYPGLGKLFFMAVQYRDYPLVQAITIVTAAMFITINLLVDIAYTAIDPRIRAMQARQGKEK